ncbi:hypothetical protein [Phascolarctobacterium faecium]|uniref:hypothetical protein n=1 Tax=Phascolarctobacterium faecium TaxID=33025 RepID=UPI0026602D67|nr:hypothetical protein [Phascolarctobacterium faecium]
MFQELQILGFPEKFEIVKFSVYSVDKDFRGLICVVKNESINVYDYFYNKRYVESRGWHVVSENNFLKNKMKLSVVKNNEECTLSFINSY